MKTIHLAVMAATMLFSFAAWAKPVDINSADAKTIADSVSGIGLAKAEAIVNYRQKNGPFKKVEDLTKVKGLGSKIVEKIRPDIMITKH